MRIFRIIIELVLLFLLFPRLLSWKLHWQSPKAQRRKGTSFQVLGVSLPESKPRWLGNNTEKSKSNRAGWIPVHQVLCTAPRKENSKDQWLPSLRPPGCASVWLTGYIHTFTPTNGSIVSSPNLGEPNVYQDSWGFRASLIELLKK